MDLSICTEEGSNCNIINDNNRSTVDILVNSWGYTDLLPENVPLFDKVPYQVHLFVATLLILLCKSKQLFQTKIETNQLISCTYFQVFWEA